MSIPERDLKEFIKEYKKVGFFKLAKTAWFSFQKISFKVSLFERKANYLFLNNSETKVKKGIFMRNN